MSTNVAGPEIERLVQLLARLPGLGPRSARRVALHLIRKRETLLAPLADALRVAQRPTRIRVCLALGPIANDAAAALRRLLRRKRAWAKSLLECRFLAARVNPGRTTSLRVGSSARRKR